MLHHKTHFEQRVHKDENNKEIKKLHSMTEVMKNLEADPAQRDSLLKLSSLCESYTGLQELSDTDQFEQFLNFNTSTSVNELNRCLLNECCEAETLRDMEFPIDLAQIIYRSNSCKLRKKELVD